jgi:hypothetical protein
MAVLQRVALYPNERFDTPDARALESFSLNDWRYFISGVMSDSSVILTGFDIVNYSTMFTVPGFQLKVDNVVFFHPESTTQAAGFYVFAGTEPDETVTLSPSSTNFVELDLDVESGTNDVRAFWDQGANGNEGGEYTDSVETVIDLKTAITSNVSGFTSGKIPLYKVVTNASNVATSVTDCRPLFFRLGTGGSTPDPTADFTFPSLPDAAHERLETPITATSATASNQPWQGGDKNLTSLKDWMDVVMTSIKEIKGVPYWYMAGSASSTVPGAYLNAALTTLIGGTWEHDSVTSGELKLISGTSLIRMGYTNNLTLSAISAVDLTTYPALYIIIPSTDTAVTYGFGQDGTTPVTPMDITGVTATSVTVNTGGNYATGGGTIMIRGQEFTYTAYASGTGLFSGVSPDPSGLATIGDDVYAIDNGGTGYYHYSATSKVPGLSGTVSEGAERVFWLAVYDGINKIQLKKGDLEKGEQIEVSDNTSLNLIAYIGASGESDSTPEYSAKLANVANISLTDNTDDLTTGIKKVDATNQDHHSKLIGGGNAWNVTITDEQQTLTFNVSPDYGTFTITHDGNTTASLAYNATGATIAAALNALPSLSEVTVSRVGTVITINFVGADGDTDQPEVTATPAMEAYPLAIEANEEFRCSYSTALLPTYDAEYVSATSATGTPTGAVPVPAPYVGGIGVAFPAGPPAYVSYVDPTTPSGGLIGGARCKVYFDPAGPPLVGGPCSIMSFVNPGAFPTLELHVDTATGAFTFYINDDFGARIPAVPLGYTSPPLFVPGTVHEVEVSWDYVVGDYYFFVDGVLVGFGIGTGAAPPRTPSTVQVGNDIFLPSADQLIIDDVQIYSTIQNTAPYPVYPSLDVTTVTMTPATTIVGGEGELAFTDHAYIQIPGLPNTRNRINVSESPVSLDDGDVAHVTVNRDTGASADLSVNVDPVASLTLTGNTFVMARRVGNTIFVGNNTFALRDREYLETDGALQEINRYFGQLKLITHERDVDKVRMSGADINMLDGRILSQEISNLLVDYSGAVIDFTTGTITTDDGVTALGIDFTPYAVPVGEYFWYSVTAIASTVNADNTISMQVFVVPATASNAVEANAPKAAFADGKKSAAVLVYNNGGSIEVSKIRQLGVGSGIGDGGDASDIQTRVDIIQDNSFYELGTTSDIDRDGEDKIDTGSSNGELNIVDSTYDLNAGEYLTSIDLIDFDEFNENKDIDRVIALLFQSSSSYDDSITLEVSRDGGNHYQSSSVEKVGEKTDLWRMDHEFTTEMDPFSDSFTDTSITEGLEGSSSVSMLAQVFTLPAKGTIASISLYLSRIGTISGNAKISLYQDDGSGFPATTLSGRLAESDWFDVSAYPTSVTEKVITFTDPVELDAGDYHIVISTDSTYKGSYVVPTDILRVHVGTGTPLLSAYSPSGWIIGPPNERLAYQVTGEVEHHDDLAEYSLSLANGGKELDTTANQKRGQEFTLTGTLSQIKRITLNMGRVGSPDGYFYAQIVNDNAGVPGSTIYATSQAISVDDVTTSGTADIGIPISAMLPAGTYHFVIYTDQAYKNSFVSTTHAININTHGGGGVPTPYLTNYNGTTWSSEFGFHIVYEVEGREVELRLKATASADCSITGFAVLYADHLGAVATGEKLFQKFNVDGSSPPDSLDVTNFNIDVDLVQIKDVDTGLTFGIGGTQGWALQGNSLIPPSNFNWVNRSYEFHVWQPSAGGYDNSDQNAKDIAQSHLSSKAISGRGWQVKREDGQLVEGSIDSSNNLVISEISSPPQPVAVIGPNVRNIIINGGMDYAQRRPSASDSLTTNWNYQVHDRFVVKYGGTWSAAPTIVQSTDNPGQEADQSMRFDGTPTGADAELYFAQRIEAKNCKKLRSKKLSMAVELISDNFEAAEITIAYADTEDNFSTVTNIAVREEPLTADSDWHRIKVEDIELPDNAANGLLIQVKLKDPATLSVASFINATEVVTNIGVAVINFQRAGYDIGSELYLCQRYYEKSYNLDVQPGTITNLGNECKALAGGSSNAVQYSVKIVPKRVNSYTATIYSSQTGASGKTYEAGTGDLTASAPSNHQGKFNFAINVTNATSAKRHYFHWLVDAEL